MGKLVLGLQRISEIIAAYDVHYFTLVLVALLCISLLVNYYLKNKRFYDLAAKIPGPPVTLPLIGHGYLFLGLNMTEVLQQMVTLVKTYHTPLKYWLGPKLVVGIADPKDVEAILTSEDAINKPYVYSFFNLQSNGIFIASGDNWRRMRKMTNVTFNMKLLEQFMTIFNEESQTLCQVLRQHSDGRVIDIHEFVARCTLDMVCGAQMGVRTKEQTENTSDFDHYVSRSTHILVERVHKAHLHPDFIFNLTSSSREHKGIIEHVKKFIDNVIKQRKRIRELQKNVQDFEDKVSPVKQRTIFLDAILDNYNNKTDKELVALVADMIIGGSDLSSVAASYALLMLAMHPEVQEKVYQEQLELFGNSEGPLTITDLNDMKYLDMVIKETLRIFSAPASARVLSSDIDIENYTLPAGAVVYISTFCLHRDSRYWQYPNIFYPEHFTPDNTANRPKFSFIPFFMGPRNCPGHKYGALAMKTILAHVVRNYVLSSPIKLEDMRYKMAFMLIPSNGYPVILKCRHAEPNKLFK